MFCVLFSWRIVGNEEEQLFLFVLQLPGAYFRRGPKASNKFPFYQSHKLYNPCRYGCWYRPLKLGTCGPSHYHLWDPPLETLPAPLVLDIKLCLIYCEISKEFFFRQVTLSFPNFAMSFVSVSFLTQGHKEIKPSLFFFD